MRRRAVVLLHARGGGPAAPAIFQCEKGALQQTLPWDLTSVPSTSAELRGLFAAWKSAHGKSYDSPAQDELRRGIFEVNARSVAAHNSKQSKSFTMELNQFADTTWDEFQSWYLGAPQQCSATTEESGLEYGEVPTEKDWRADGAVSPSRTRASAARAGPSRPRAASRAT